MAIMFSKSSPAATGSITFTGTGPGMTAGTAAPPVPPGVPTGLSATNGYNSIFVSFTVPADNGSPITEYQVINAADDTNITTLLAAGESLGSTKNAQVFVPPGSYTVKVSAGNAGGWSAYSNTDSATSLPSYKMIASGSISHNGSTAAWPAFDAGAPPATLSGGWTLEGTDKDGRPTYAFDTHASGAYDGATGAREITWDVQVGLSGTYLFESSPRSGGSASGPLAGATLLEAANLTGSAYPVFSNIELDGKGNPIMVPAPIAAGDYMGVSISTWNGTTAGWDNNGWAVAFFKLFVDGDV